MKDNKIFKITDAYVNIAPGECPWKGTSHNCVEGGVVCPSFCGLKKESIQCGYPNKHSSFSDFIQKIGIKKGIATQLQELKILQIKPEQHCPWNMDEHSVCHTCASFDERCFHFNGIEYKKTIECSYHKEVQDVERRVVLYIAMSLDGYIADEKGGIDWLDNGDIDYDGYEPFLDTIDTVVMGRVTYQQIIEELSIGKWPYEGKKGYVASKEILGRDENVSFINYDVSGFIRYLKQQKGKDIWLVGGAKLISDCVKDNIIDEYHISIIPTILGKGIKLFPNDGTAIPLDLQSSKAYGNMMVMRYTKKAES